jgi:hypothetical protein
MADNFPGSASDPTSSAVEAVSITPSDTATFDVTRGLYIGTTGNVAVKMKNGVTITFTNVPVGVLPVRVQQVLSTGTTASGIIALY